MNILLLGSGGREHALAWKMAASPLADRLVCAPGNAGIAREAECVALDIADHAAVIAFCRANAHRFRRGRAGGAALRRHRRRSRSRRHQGVRTEPRAAARLEGSKGFTKDLCRANGIPTAAYERFRGGGAGQGLCRAKRRRADRDQGRRSRRRQGRRAWRRRIAEAEAAIDMMLGGGLGEAGAEVVVEEFLAGEEASFFALCDGDNAIPLATAQDHKRAFDGDKGPNTGGMGAYSPAAIIDAAMSERVMREIVEPTLRAMKAMGAPYKGVLYAGLMITTEGPKLIEYNVRFGDPECQVLMLRLMSDLVPALLAARDGLLKSFDLRWYQDPALTVVMAANGYPGAYAKGSVIEGLDEAAAVEGVEIFHAGTMAEGGRILANGGRVLNVTAIGATVREARERAYAAVSRIHWPEGFCRHDIGWRAMERER